MPASARSASARALEATSRSLCSSRWAISGSMVLSWKLPDWPASAMAASLPTTAATAIATASGITGLTLPGMMLEPGCSSGRRHLAEPGQGPEFIQRRSPGDLRQHDRGAAQLADSSTAVSWAAMAANRSAPS
jgi:hypothetical protein